MHSHLIYKYLVCYAIFFVSVSLSKFNDGSRLIDKKGLVRQPGILIGLNISGILWLGLVASSILHLAIIETIVGNAAPSILQAITLLSLLFIASVFAWLHGLRYTINNRKENPSWFLSLHFIYKYVVIRMAFLITLELWFRGFLLQDCIPQFGTTVAVLINVTLYTLPGLFAGKKEITARFVFGLVLCYLAIWFKAAWPAILLHSTIVIAYETTLLKRFFISQKYQHVSELRGAAISH